MPKAPVNKYDQTKSWQHYIGRPGQVTPMQSKSEPLGAQDPTGNELRGSVLTPDRLHPGRYVGGYRGSMRAHVGASDSLSYGPVTGCARYVAV